jgi:hypothetical protein
MGNEVSADRPQPRSDLKGQAGSASAIDLDPALLTQGSGSPNGSSPSGSQASGSAEAAEFNASQKTAQPGASTGSGLVLGSDSSSEAKSSKADATASTRRFGSRIPDGPTKTIDVPFEIVVVCQPEGLVIHPGGYLITRASLERNRKDGILVNELLAVARNRAAVDPTIRPQPRVKFLVESGGSPVFWNARKQILFSGLGWPISLQVTGAQDVRLLDQETW